MGTDMLREKIDNWNRRETEKFNSLSSIGQLVYIIKPLVIIALILFIICCSTGIYNRTINKAQSVNEAHQDLVESHSYNYCPYCGEKLIEEGN